MKRPFRNIRTILCLLLLPLALVFSACQATPQKQAVNTLAVTGQVGNSAYESYLQLVLQGNLPTNDVPKVTGYYRDFQTSFAVAAAAAHYATNITLASPELVQTLNKLQNAITEIQGRHQ